MPYKDAKRKTEWERLHRPQRLDTGRLGKSATVPSSELAALRVQVRAQMDDLVKKINGLIERRTVATGSARLNINGVEKNEVAQQELTQAPLAAVSREAC